MSDIIGKKHAAQTQERWEELELRNAMVQLARCIDKGDMRTVNAVCWALVLSSKGKLDLASAEGWGTFRSVHAMLGDE